MSIEIKTEISNYYELKEQLWGSNVAYELDKIENWGMENEFFSYIEELFGDTIYDITTINDYVAYEFSASEWIIEYKTLDDVESLEELKEYATNSDVYDVLDTAINSDYADDLWEYITESYMGDSLSTVFDELTSLEPNDYISFDNIKSLTEFIKLVEDNDIVMEVINAIKEANLIDEYWNKLEEECKGINYTVANVVDDIESLDVDELIESL